MKKTIYGILTASTLLLSSCNEFLTELPETAIPEEDAMVTLTDAEQVVLGIYSTFKNPALYSGSMVEATEVQSDLFYAAIGFTNQLGDFYRWEIRPNETTLLSIYGGLYQIVNRCNFFFDHMDAVEKTLKTTTEKDLLKKYAADAAFMRAYAYHDLVRLFCKPYEPATADKDMGVPLYLHYRVEGKTVEVLPRASMKECYEQMLKDLKFAAENEPRKGTNTQFITQGAVTALHARLALYMHDWERADSLASEVIDAKVNGVRIYELADAFYNAYTPYGELSNEYDMMLTYDDSEEIIWKISFSNTDYTGCLGAFFMGINSGRYNPNYLPADALIMSFRDYDKRYESGFPIVSTMHSGRTNVCSKYPGNPTIDGNAGPYYCNMPKMIRLSEIYLIRAEARCMLEKTRLACEDLTTLQKKRIKDFGSFLCEQSQLLEAIQDERARELVAEGFRLTDLKRWHMGFERMPQPGTLEGPRYSSLKVESDAQLFVWPIPQHEITASGGIVIQN